MTLSFEAVEDAGIDRQLLLLHACVSQESQDSPRNCRPLDFNAE
jgi:hypothetical protein